MKKNIKNEEKSLISSMFTEKELKELDFTPEEIEILETAEAICMANDVMPDSEKDMDAFFDKFDATFPPSADFEGTFKKFMNLQNTDPKFLQQIIAMSALLDTVEEVPAAETQKVSMADIEKEKAAVANEDQKARFARIDAMLKKLAEEEKK